MMKRISRSVVAWTVAVMMAAVGLTGCGGKKEAEGNKNAPGTGATPTTQALTPAKIKWVLRIPVQKDGEEVLAEVNKTFQEKINATLSIQFIESAAYAEKTKLMIAAGEEFDIIFTAQNYQYNEHVAKGAFIPLDELVTKYAPKAYGQIPTSFWEATKVNNKIYGFPNYQIAARQTVMLIRKDMAEKYNMNLKSITKLEDYEPYLAKMKAGEPFDKFLFAGPSITHMDNMNYMGLETLGGEGTPGAIEIDGKDYKVYNQYEHPSLIQYVKTLKSWADKGYINKDLSLVKDHTELYKNAKILSSMSNYKPGGDVDTLTRFGYEPVNAFLTQPYVSTSSVTATMQAISRTSKNPERAMMLLEIVNTDKKLYNTLVYGIEGKHYKKTGDNSVEVIQNSGYSTNVSWMLGYQLNAYLLPGVAADIPKQIDELNKSAKASRIMGFSFDTEPVKSEIAQCLTVKDKYASGFSYGMYEVDSTLAAMNKELKAAGMDKIIAEKQKQLDAWVAAKKK